MRHAHRITIITLLVSLAWIPLADAQALSEEEASFQTGGLTLHGTVVLPPDEGPWPAVVLLHGAGLGRRDDYRHIAEALAERGIVTFIYDKRTERYSASPIGSRSFSLLAADAIAAVQMLRERDDVDPSRVGLWGLSEGGWVAPLAASQAPEIAFVITVAGGGIGPADQTAWATEQAIRYSEVTSSGALRALADRAYRFFVSAEFFPEGMFDPIPALERLSQPILALWGANDRLMPAVASASVMRETLDRAGHTRYVIRVIPEADHEMRVSEDGFTHSEVYAPGYFDLMVAWINETSSTEQVGPIFDTLGLKESSVPHIRDSHGMARWEVQLAFFIAFHMTFGGFLVAGVFRFLKRRQSLRALSPSGHSPSTSRSPFEVTSVPWRDRVRGRWGTGVVAILGLLVPWCLYGYAGFIAARGGRGVGPVVAGRPLGWLLIQLGAIAILLLALSLSVAWLRGRLALQSVGAGRLSLLLVGTALFLPWAAWWQLFAW